MPYPTTVDTGQVVPWALYAGDLSSATAGTITANVAIFIAATLYGSATLVGFKVRFGTGGAGNYDVGLYDASGARMTHIGSTVTASGFQNPSVTPLPLSPGRYWLGFWIDNATDTVNRLAGATGGVDIVQFIGSVSGGLPASTSGATAATNKIAVVGLLQGGWS